MSAAKTLEQLLRERDYLRDRLASFDQVNHLAYRKWPETKKIAFDVDREKTRQALDSAEHAYADAVKQTAQGGQRT